MCGGAGRNVTPARVVDAHRAERDLDGLGGLLADWAERLGLPQGLPVIAGTYDSFVDLAAAGVQRPGDSGVVLGSTMIICRAATDDALPPPGLGSSPYPGEGILVGRLDALGRTRARLVRAALRRLARARCGGG